MCQIGSIRQTRSGNYKVIGIKNEVDDSFVSDV